MNVVSQESDCFGHNSEQQQRRRTHQGGKQFLASHKVYSYTCVGLLFINYFLAQYDKFVLSYFQSSVISTLSLSATEYALLSGYATGIAYALLAIPIAGIADYTSARVWTLTILSAWWSLCVVFQGLAHNFWQMFLARIGMGIGQACVEALSLSLISDLLPWREAFFGDSIFYVGVYIGEAISGQIATAFTATGTSWQVAMRAIGITGCIVAVFGRLLLREPARQDGLLKLSGRVTAFDSAHGNIVSNLGAQVNFHSSTTNSFVGTIPTESKYQAAIKDLKDTMSYIVRMQSFWLLLLSASFRQLAGNVFGYYMPGYLIEIFPRQTKLLSNYGIIAGTAGSVSVLSGGALTNFLWTKTKLTPIYLTAVGGMLSSVFVLLMIFSKDAANGDQDRGSEILYGCMSAAYLTAELWLGALFTLVAYLLPPRYKTFGLAIWSSFQVLIYSSGPEIIGLSLRNTNVSDAAYAKITQVALAVIIVVGYWLAGVGLLAAVPLLKRDLRADFVVGKMSLQRRVLFSVSTFVVAALVITLFTVSIIYKA